MKNAIVKAQNFVQRHKKSASMLIATTIVSCLCCISASAEGETALNYANINSTLSSGFTTAGQNMLTTISSVLPIVLSILGVIVAINLGIKFFKRYSK